MLEEDIIRLLPDSVANQIAAGEVIQRPASIVKELVENSIDAGATSIEIIIKEGGRALVQVVDNGKGMSPTDARMAFERHATSKIAAADDLAKLRTMGFRGEALPSIAAVAQIDLRTMRPGDHVGTRLLIAGSKVEGQEPTACPPGTNMMVKNIFAYLPARRKFLKSESVEFSHITHEFERLALVNTDVDFTLVHNDVTLHQLHRSSLKQRITALFGKAIGHQLIPVETESSIVRISGFVTLPQYARKRGAHQYFFVNGRNMRHPYFAKAILNCYSELSSAGTQPGYFINLEVDPERIDVNIHPQKHEIKFEDEQSIWQILSAAVKEALGKANASGAIDFDTDDAPDIPFFDPDAVGLEPGADVDPNYNPFDTQRSFTPSVDKDWQKLYEDFTARAAQDMPAPGDDSTTLVASRLGGNAEGVEAVRSRLNAVPDVAPPPPDVDLGLGVEVPKSESSIFTLHNRYIVSPTRSGLMLVDRHRAHVRVLYEKFCRRLSEGNVESQQLLFPEAVEVSASGSVALQTFSKELADLGFDMAFLGDNTWNITAVPSMAAGANAGELLMRLVEQLDLSGEARESLIRPVAISMARAAAVKSDTVWSRSETESLLFELLALPTPDFTPDGLTVIRTITHQQLDNMFE